MLVGGLRPFLDAHRMRAASGTLCVEGALSEGPLPFRAAEVMRNDVPMGCEHAGSGPWRPKLRA